MPCVSPGSWAYFIFGQLDKATPQLLRDTFQEFRGRWLSSLDPSFGTIGPIYPNLVGMLPSVVCGECLEPARLIASSGFFTIKCIEP